MVEIRKGGCRAARGPWMAILLVPLFLLVAPAVARAQLSVEQKQEVRRHYDKATRAYDVGKYDEAILEYQSVYEISGDPKMLYNLGQAHRLNDDPQQAVRFYRRYLERLPNAPNKDDVDKKIADLVQTMADRRKAAESAAAAKSAPAVVVPVASPPPPVSPQPLENGAPPDNGIGAGRITSIVFFGVGAAGLIVAGIEGAIAKEKSDQLSSDSQKMGTVAFDPSLESAGKTANTVAIAAVIAGGACLITGGILFLLSGDSGEGGHRAQAMVAPVVGPHWAGASAAWTF